MSLLLEHCRDIDEWSDSWEIDETDIEIGCGIIEQFKPFIISLINKDLSKKTIGIYRDYPLVLGGELIRQINEDENDRQLSAKDLILKHVDENGGPYWSHASSEADDAKYDSVCRKLFCFMIEKDGYLPTDFLNKPRLLT